MWKKCVIQFVIESSGKWAKKQLNELIIIISSPSFHLNCFYRQSFLLFVKIAFFLLNYFQNENSCLFIEFTCIINIAKMFVNCRDISSFSLGRSSSAQSRIGIRFS